MSHPLDPAALYRAVDTEREHAGYTWADLAHLTGVSRWVLLRLRQGQPLDVPGIPTRHPRALLIWLGVRCVERHQLDQHAAERFQPAITRRKKAPR